MLGYTAERLTDRLPKLSLTTYQVLVLRRGRGRGHTAILQQYCCTVVRTVVVVPVYHQYVHACSRVYQYQVLIYEQM